MTGCLARRAIAAGLLVFAHPVLAASPDLAGGEALGVSLGRILTALLICAVVALLAALVIRQRSGRGDLRALFGALRVAPGAIQVVDTRRITATSDICLVRHDGEEYLILLTSGGGQVLRRRAADPAEGAGQP